MDGKQLNSTEYLVMEILWESAVPLTNSEIQKRMIQKYPDGIKTAGNITQRLLEKEFIHVAEIVKVHKRFAQKFTPSVSAEEYLKAQLDQNFVVRNNPDKAVSSMFSHLLKNQEISDQTLEELMEMIKSRKEEP